MIDLNVHKRFRYILFSGLYAAEGLYQTILLLVTPLYLLEKNVSIPIITLVMAIGELPWALKFIWGGIIDFYHKYGRKKFTVFGTIIGAIGFLILALIDQNFSIIFFALFLFIGHMGIGFLDAAADAWAIDISTKKDRGKINASMNIGSSISGSIGGPILVIIGVTFGYHISFIIAGLIIMFLTIVPLFVKYTPKKIDKLEIWPLIKEEFSKKSTRLTTLYFFISVLNPALLLTLIVIYAKTVLLWDDMFIALVGIILLVGGTIPGSILGGVLSDKFGRKITLYIFLITGMIFSVTLIFTTDMYILIPIVGALYLSWNATTAANWAMIMDIINPKIGASEHEIICSIVNFGDIVISAAAGTLVILIGFHNIFLLSAIIVIPAIIALYPIKSSKIK